MNHFGKVEITKIFHDKRFQRNQRNATLKTTAWEANALQVIDDLQNKAKQNKTKISRICDGKMLKILEDSRFFVPWLEQRFGS